MTSIGEEAFFGCNNLSVVIDANEIVSKNYSNYSSYYDGNLASIFGIKAIIFGNSITSIGNNAFRGLRSLTSITIGNNVTSIGEGAFLDCDGLTSITIPSNVTKIGSFGFRCKNLTSVTIDSNEILSTTINSSGSFGSLVRSIFGPQVTKYIIGNNVTRLADYAFYNCSNLTSIIIPNSVESIGLQAFYNTPWYETWYNNQSDGVVYVGKVAYTYKGTMPANADITIKEGTLGIADYAFDNCKSITSITLPNSLTNIGNLAFNCCSGLTSVYFPNSVTSIGKGAFQSCSGLTSVTIPNRVTSIGSGAFSGCSGLTSITIGNSVTSIGDLAFFGCSGLTSITIPESVTSIDSYAFTRCSGLTSVTIPNSVTSIGYGAFLDCIGLTSVTALNPTPVVITAFVFPQLRISTLYVPKGSKEAYLAADYWKEFMEIIEIDITGIDQIMNNGQNNVKIFTLDGKRISKPQKGINIIGGKKVVVK